MTSTNENMRLLRPFLRGIPIIIMVVFFSLMAANRYLRYATPMYESTARIRLADTKDGSPSSNLYKDFDVFANANKIGAEIEVIKSKVLLGKVLDKIDFHTSMYRIGQIRKMELFRESPFRINYHLNDQLLMDKSFRMTVRPDRSISVWFPGNEQPVLTKVGNPVVKGTDTIQIVLNEKLLAEKPGLKVDDNYEFVIHSKAKQIEDILSHLDVTSQDKEVPVIRITYRNPVAEKASLFVNMLAQTYIDDYIETKYQSANTTVHFLDDQLNEVGNRLSASENAIEEFRDRNRIINIRQETETDLRKIADMKVQQTNVRMNLEAIEDLNSYMRSGKDPLELAPNFEAYTDLLATELIKKMKLLQANRKELLIKYTPEHEQIRVIDEQLKDITHYLEEGINNTRKNLQVKYDRISRDITEAEQAFNGLPTREKRLGILSRNFMLNEQTYNFLQVKRTEAQIASAANISFHRVISPAETAVEPVSPNRTLIRMLAAFIGFMGSLFLIYLVHALKGKVNDQTTIEKRSSIPVAAATPFIGKPAGFSTHFHKLSIQLTIKDLIRRSEILCISSFDNKEGKSFHAIGLARTLSGQGRRVLLVDVSGSMNAYMQVQGSSIGFDYKDLSVSGPLMSGVEAVENLMSEWRSAYDIILLRNEPLRNTSSGLLMMKLADANLFLVDSRKTMARTITEADLLQEEYAFPRLQFILNRAGYNPSVIGGAFRFIHSLFVKKQGPFS